MAAMIQDSDGEDELEEPLTSDSSLSQYESISPPLAPAVEDFHQQPPQEAEAQDAQRPRGTSLDPTPPKKRKSEADIMNSGSSKLKRRKTTDGDTRRKASQQTPDPFDVPHSSPTRMQSGTESHSKKHARFKDQARLTEQSPTIMDSTSSYERRIREIQHQESSKPSSLSISYETVSTAKSSASPRRPAKSEYEEDTIVFQPDGSSPQQISQGSSQDELSADLHADLHVDFRKEEAKSQASQSRSIRSSATKQIISKQAKKRPQTEVHLEQNRDQVIADEEGQHEPASSKRSKAGRSKKQKQPSVVVRIDLEEQRDVTEEKVEKHSNEQIIDVLRDQSINSSSKSAEQLAEKVHVDPSDGASAQITKEQDSKIVQRKSCEPTSLHKPSSIDGRGIHRVGLSKRNRIPSLLKIMRR